MANYRYKIYNKRGKLVAEATTKREAEKEAKKLGGHYMDHNGVKNPHCVSNPSPTTIRSELHYIADSIAKDRLCLREKKDQLKRAYNEALAQYPTKKQGREDLGPVSEWYDYFRYSNPHCVSNPGHGLSTDKILWGGGGQGFIKGEVLGTHDLYTLEKPHLGAKWVLKFYEDGRSPGRIIASGQSAENLKKQAQRLEDLQQRSNPHCYKNPADDPDFQRGFSAGLAAIAAATSYYGKRANPEPEAPSQASPAYQAGFVAAVQMFGVHLINQSDISRAVVEQLAGATLAAPPTPRPTPRKRGKKKPTLSQEPEVSALATMVLNVIPPEANSPATKVKRGMIIGAVGAIDTKAGEQLKKGAVWSATVKELIAAGLVAQDGTKRGAGYYLTGKQAMVVEEEPKKPSKKRPPKKRPPKKAEEKPAAVLNDRALAEAQAAALAAGIPQDEVDAIVTKAKEMHAKGEHPVVGIVTAGGNTLISVFPLGDKTVESVKNDLSAVDPNSRVFDVLVQSNPYFGRGKARFFGAWG